jgi:hypothetical protein
VQRNGVFVFAIAFVIAVGVVRVASTHRVFSEVLDEPAHIACGYDWLEGVPYTIDPTHPPLERLLSALPAYFQRVPLLNDPNFIARGNNILYFKDDYVHNLAAARRGNLLFFIIAAMSVAWWAWRTLGGAVALIAVALFTYLPPILGHAGVATTDMAAAAGVTLAVVTLDWYLSSRTLWRAFVLGLAIGLGLLTKFSFVLFFPIAAVIVMIVRRAVPSARSLATLGMTAILIVWAGYRFDFDTIAHAQKDGEWLMAQVGPKWIAHVPMPAPLFVAGAAMVRLHDREGHFTYLLGKTSTHGWWYYFPVVFFFKTPLPFLILALIGIAMCLTRAPAVALIPIALMLVVLPSSINIGIRHILPIYPPLCIAAAVALVAFWQSISMRAVAVLLAAWMFIGVERAHPDYLAWFNEAAGEHPEEIAVDSNLDWGQDVLRLARTVKTLGIQRFSILYTGNALLERHALAADAIQPWVEAPGWYVLSETGLALNPDARRGAYKWLDAYRVRRIGKSMRLIHVPALAQ